MSKALATFATQPLIVAKVGLQSRPPPAREGKPFKSFVEVMAYIVEHEGLMSLFKGIGPQLMKGLIVQGILMMTKERCVVLHYTLKFYANKISQIRAGFHCPFPPNESTSRRETCEAGGSGGRKGTSCEAGASEVKAN
jgi:hypothetical protein